MSLPRLDWYKWELIALLWLAYFFNQADRQVYSVVLKPLSTELRLSDPQAGLVASIFMWTYALMVPVAGYAGDVLRRKWIVVGSLLFWSLATIVSGASAGLLGLVFFRGLATGGGEAFYYPAANSLIGQYHDRTRALAMSIHQTSLYAGTVASGLIAGWLSEHFGWRTSFYGFGAVGLVLTVIILLRVKDVDRPVVAAGAAESRRPPPLAVLRAVGRKRTVWALCAAFAGYNFAGWSYVTWMPTFLQERFGLSATRAGFSAMFYTNVLALASVLLVGKLSDAWAPRRRTLRMECQLWGLLLGIPCLVLMGLADRLWLCYLGLAGFGLCRGIYDSNLFAALFDVIEPRYRASAVGTMLALSFAVAGLGPLALGWAKPRIGLPAGIALLSLALLASATAIGLAIKTSLARDRIESEGVRPR
jgi:MFS family permease